MWNLQNAKKKKMIEIPAGTLDKSQAFSQKKQADLSGYTLQPDVPNFLKKKIQGSLRWPRQW